MIGASGHGKVCSDIAEQSGYKNIEFLDDDKQVTSCGKYSVVGKVDNYKDYIDGCDFFISIGNTCTRAAFSQMIVNAGGNLVTLIHPNAVISQDVRIGLGTVVMAGTVINANAEIGAGCIINTCSSIDHDCCINDYVHVSVGSHICGTSSIGKNTWVGAGAIISNNIDVCEGCMIGAGAVVVKNISTAGTYVGVPAHIV